MKIIKPTFVIETSINNNELLKQIERAGRTSYKSEDKITEDSVSKFVQMIMKRDHLSVIEHSFITVRVICDRGVSHEIVRHRLASYTQESTRYCNYSQGKFGNEITVIKPCFWNEDDEKYKVWYETMRNIGESYNKLISLGAYPSRSEECSPQFIKNRNCYYNEFT
jgi:thymidylate synthase (FAD)